MECMQIAEGGGAGAAAARAAKIAASRELRCPATILIRRVTCIFRHIFSARNPISVCCDIFVLQIRGPIESRK